MNQVRISDEALAEALTLDQLIEELIAAKKSGLATGKEKVCFGTGFMHNVFPGKSVLLMPNVDGEMTIGVSAESELHWGEAMSAVDNDRFNIVDAAKAGADDPLELARRLGFEKRVSEMESEQLGVAAPASTAKPKRKSAAPKGL